MPYLRSVVLGGGKYQQSSSSRVITSNLTKILYIAFSIDVKFGLTTYIYNKPSPGGPSTWHLVRGAAVFRGI